MSTKQRQWVLLACVAVARGSVCFPDALPPEQLKQLKHPNGEEYNVGVWVSDWSAAHVVSQLAITLIKEKLGFNVSEGKGAGTPNAVYALTGCRSPGNLMEPQCDADITYFHINLESWVEDYPQLWMDMQSRHPLMAPKNLGSMGYHGRTSIYIPTPILEAAYYGEGLSLGYYRGYNVTWNDPSKYFDRMSSIAQGRVKPCSETRLTDSAIMKTYVEITGDLDGVMITGEQYAGKCPDQHFWISPACRAQHDRCIPFFTGGDGWDIEGYLQKSTSWNMPMAIAVAASWTDYQLLPLQFKSLFYWWVPDPTFLELVPEEVMFPPFDRLKWFAGDRRVSSPDIPIDKVVSQDLSMLAPNVEAFIQKFRIEMASVNEIMRETMNSEEGVEAETCKWLRANEKIWKSWLPDETECFPGFGLYDLVEQVYVHDRKEPVGKKCQACPSGTFSSKLVDDVGVTYICVQCPQGYSQPSGASLSCEECHEGKYQDQLGSRTCKPCGLSHYQDARGQASCKACPNDSTTVRIGSVSFLDCGCQKGQIDVSSPEEDLVCHSCPDGLHCPVMSRTQSFLDGVATSASEGVDLGSDFVPALLEGFHCTKTQPLKIFRCGKVEHCPGGAPGTCAGGRVGLACGECMADFRWTGKKCEVCGETRVVWAIAIAGILGGLALMPVVLLPGHTTSSKATMIFTITCVFGLLAHNAQSVAVIGNLNVQWPTSWSAMFEYFQILLLDTESTGVVCLSAITSMPRYVASTLFFPCALAWMLLVYGLTRLLPRRFQWTLNKTLNAMGMFTQVGFTAMSQIAMVPWMCYSHPNGESSLFKYPNTLCNSAEHHGMLVAGLLLFAFVLGFLALCTYLAWTIPAKARTGSMVHLESARFLVFRFRLDRWWYGVPLLLKGPAMSIVMVVATDHPRVQNFLLLAVLELFLILGCLAWPWKVPAVNTLDVQGSLCLVLFAVLGFFCSPSRTETESNFADVSAATLLVYMALVMLVAGSLSCLSFLWRLLTGEDQWIQRFMNLGWTPTPAEVVEELKRVSNRVLMTKGGTLQRRVGEMVGGDLQRIMYCIDLIDVDLFHSESQLGLQRIMSSRMRRSSLAAPESGTKSLHDGDENVTESLEVSPATTGIKVEVAEERAAPQSDLDREVQETIFGPIEEGALVKEEL